MYGCHELKTLVEFVVEVDCHTVVEEGFDKVVLAPGLVTGEVSVEESDCFEKIFWRIGKTARVLDLTREVAMCHDLKLWYIEVLGDLVGLSMLQEEDALTVGLGGEIAASVAVSCKRYNGSLRGSINTGLQPALCVVLERVIE